MQQWKIIICLILLIVRWSESSQAEKNDGSEERRLLSLRHDVIAFVNHQLAVNKAQPTPGTPTLANSFNTDVEVYEVLEPFYGQPFKLTGTLLYDDKQGAKQTLNQPMPFGPPGLQQLTFVEYLNRHGLCLDIMGINRQASTTPFSSWYSWIKYATYLGTAPCYSLALLSQRPSFSTSPGPKDMSSTSLHGKESLASSEPIICNVWNLFVHEEDKTVNLTAFVYSNLILHEQILQNSTVGGVATKTEVDMLYYNPVQINSTLPEHDFEPQGLCNRSYGEPCARSNETPTLTMVRFHPTNQTLALANQNTADVTGDVAFLCESLLSGTFTVLQQISMYHIQINATFGCYAFCNFELCLGGDPFLVGREALNGLGLPAAGQCADNLYGTWYSLPAAGQCSSSQSPASGLCSWKLLQVVKTISSQCLLAQQFNQACIADGAVPFPSATNVLLRAFDSDDPSLGGCPNLFSPSS